MGIKEIIKKYEGKISKLLEENRRYKMYEHVNSPYILDKIKEYEEYLIDIKATHDYIEPINIFVICSVRDASDEYKERLEKYVDGLEKLDHKIHLPHRDTNQEASGLEICVENKKAISNADEVHIFYSSKSQGTHFDMGVAFALKKPLVVIENEKYGEGKSYPRMVDEWQSQTPE